MFQMRTLKNGDAWRDVGRDAMHRVSTAEPVPPPLAMTYATKNKFAPQSKNLAAIICGFESSMTGIVNHSTGKFESGRTRTLENGDAWRDVDRNNNLNTMIDNQLIGNIGMCRMRTLENIDARRDVGRDAMHCVSTAEWVPPPLATTYATKNKFAPQSENLAAIIRGFESSMTGIVNHSTGKFESAERARWKMLVRVATWVETQCIASLRPNVCHHP